MSEIVSQQNDQRRMQGLNDPFSRFNTPVKQARDPILQAADIQAQAIEQAIPFFEPYMQAGQQGLGYAQNASSAQGIDQILAQIFGGEGFQNLRDERTRSVQGQLAAGGLTRSGEAISAAADIPTELGFALEQMLFGRNQDLSTQGQSSAISIADLLRGSAEATASGILGLEERRAANRANSSNNNTDLLGAVIKGAFSDPSLKENIREVGKVGPLTLCLWDWKQETKGTIVEESPRVGFMSTEVREHYPDYVSQFGGYDLIDYKGLVEELENATS